MGVSKNPKQVDSSIPGQDNWLSGSLMHPHAFTVGNLRVGTLGSDGDHNPNGQLIIAGSPDGPNTNGCLVCVFDTTTALNIAGISGGGSSNWVNGPTGIAQYGSADSPVEYIVQDNARMQILNLQVAAYTVSGITLASPMSADQMARIHYGMYVISNSVDTSLPTPNFSATSSLPLPNYYASTVVGVIDSTHIQVSGWAVPGAGNNASGQVPSVSNLDTKWTNFGMPTVGIGGRTSTSAVNWVTNFTTTNSWLNNYENEIDILGNPGFAPGRMRIRGLTMTYQGPTPSADSWALNLNTVSLPVQMHMEVNPTGYGIQSNSFLTRGNSGVSVLGSATWEMAEHAAFAGGANNMRLATWLSQDTGTTGYGGVSVHQGLLVDGEQGKVGTPQAQVVYDPLLPGYTANSTGTLGFADYNGIVFALENDNATVTQGHYLAIQQSGWKSGDSSPMLQAASPSQLNVRDTAGGGITLNSYNLTITNSLVLPIKTPTSSKAPCKKGQIEDDLNYHYVCVAANRWKRVALSDF